MHRKEENLTENHTTPMFSEIHTKLSIDEGSLSIFMNSFFRKAKSKVETSSLRNLKIMSRNLNEILLARNFICDRSWTEGGGGC